MYNMKCVKSIAKMVQINFIWFWQICMSRQPLNLWFNGIHLISLECPLMETYHGETEAKADTLAWFDELIAKADMIRRKSVNWCEILRMVASTQLLQQLKCRCRCKIVIFFHGEATRVFTKFDLRVHKVFMKWILGIYQNGKLCYRCDAEF